MKQEFVTVRNSITGKVGRVRRRIAEHPVFGLNQEIVPDGTKDKISLVDLVIEQRGFEISENDYEAEEEVID